MTQTSEQLPRGEDLPRGTVVIAGGGPVGLLLAKVLSHYGVKSVLAERNKATTKWPKMDLTNPRSMEIFRRLGLSEGLRKRGVAAHIEQPVLISSGLGTEKPISSWDHPSVDRFRQHIAEHNDGTQPLEAWQRVSQVIFEKWLKEICDQDPLIDVRFGWRVDSVHESNSNVRSTLINVDTGDSVVLTSDYLAGCDGASSRTRQCSALSLDGGPTAGCVLLVHFKSRDLTRLQKQGQFWHIFFLGPPGELGGAIIAQDEVDTWTTHRFLPLDADVDTISSEDAVYEVLGGLYEKYPIKIDEILVRSVWRPNIAVARNYVGPHTRVFLAGDSAHQNIPTGGYGMNLGIGDAYDLGWKLAAVINGSAGKALLQSYEEERRPVALRNVERSGVHFDVHQQLKPLLMGGDPRRIDQDTEEGRALRLRIHNHYQENDGENKDIGIEMDNRYKSTVIIPSESGEEPPWTTSRYTPSTWPGSRSPHVFLSDGTPIFDHFGKDWTLLSFSKEPLGQPFLLDSASRCEIPLTHVCLAEEVLAKKLYEKPLVLIRPDQHVAWRGDVISSRDEAQRILLTVVGKLQALPDTTPILGKAGMKPDEMFTTTVGLTTQVSQFELEKMGDFQR